MTGISGVKSSVPTNYVTSVSYAAHGAASSLTFGSGSAAAISYEPFGGMAQVALANGLTESRTFDSGMRLKTLNVAKSGGCQAVLALGNTYAANGNLTEQQIGRDCGAFEVKQDAGAWGYDGANRLLGWKEWKTAEPGLSNWYRTYNYDRYGNGWVPDPVGVPATSFTPRSEAWFNERNRLVPPGLASSYDGAGNLTMIGAVTMDYDGENKLKTYAGAVGYAYDGEGRRVTKTVGAQTTVMVYDALGRLAAEYGGTTSVSGRQYVTADALGSTRLVSNEAGGTLRCADYVPYGEEIGVDVGSRPACYGGNGGVKLKFTGKERDAETANSGMGDGLDYFGARYYAGVMGRFTSPDPLMASAKVSNPQSWNRYSYTFNNPLRFTDPTGMYTCEGTKEQCDQFEKSRAAILKSKDGDAVRAANAYGKAKTDNGVIVRFADKLQDRGGTVGRIDTGLRIDPNNPNKFQATLVATIQSDNISNQETIAHEGSHVADYQAFVNSIDMAGNMDQSLNITHMATEVRAYELSVRYAISGNSSLNFGPCGGPGGECKFSPGMLPAVRDRQIIDLLTDTRNKYTGLNTVLYPELLKPQQK